MQPSVCVRDGMKLWCLSVSGQRLVGERYGQLNSDRWSTILLQVWKMKHGQIRNLILSPSAYLSFTSVEKRWCLGVECVSQEEEDGVLWWGRGEGYPAVILNGLITGNKPGCARHYADSQSPHPKPLAERVTSLKESLLNQILLGEHLIILNTISFNKYNFQKSINCQKTIELTGCSCRSVSNAQLL